MLKTLLPRLMNLKKSRRITAGIASKKPLTIPIRRPLSITGVQLYFLTKLLLGKITQIMKLKIKLKIIKTPKKVGNIQTHLAMHTTFDLKIGVVR